MHFKQNNKESKTYVQGLRLFGNTLPRSIKGILKKRGYNYSEIVGKWDKLVGKQIASFSFPKSIKMNKGDTHGILLLGVKRGNEITVEYSKREIIDKINSYFGYKLINEIRLQGYGSKNEKKIKKDLKKYFSKNFNKKINEIENERIRNSLFQLFDAIKND